LIFEMKRVCKILLILASIWAVTAPVTYGKNAGGDKAGGGGPATGNPDNSTNGDGGKNGDSKGNGHKGDPGDSNKENCSVVFEMNIGSFQTEFDESDVFLRIKRLKPTPLLFTPQSLFFDSPLASDVFLTPDSPEAEALQQAQLSVEIASSDVTEAQSDVGSTLTTKDAAYATLQQAEQDLVDAQAALDADPENTELQQAVTDATAARDTAQTDYDTALANYNAAVTALSTFQQDLTSAQSDLSAAQGVYDSFVSTQQSAGTLVTNSSGVALGQITIERPRGTTISYKPDTASGLWKPIGEEIYYASRIKAISANKFSRIDGEGRQFIFDAVEGALPEFQFPNGRKIDANSAGVRQEIIRQSGILRQAVTAQTLADVVVLDELSYEVRLYRIEDRGLKNSSGIYEPVGTPFVKFKVENPTGNPNTLSSVRITTTKGNRVDVGEWNYSESAKAWSFTEGTGSDAVTVNKTITELTTGEKIYEWDIVNANSDLIERRNETITPFAWGDMATQKVMDPGGINLVQTFDYYTDQSAGEKYGKLKTQVDPDGSWVSMDYDSLGREAVKIEPWLDSPVGSAAADAKATYYDYTPVDPQDSLLEYDRRVRTETVEVLGQTTKKTFYAYFTNGSSEYVEIEEMAATPTAAYGASANLRRTKTHYPETDPEVTAGRLKTEKHPDGRLDTYTYERLADNTFITTVTHGVIEAPAGVANKTTREVITVDPKGNETLREIYIYTGSTYELAETIEQEFDERGQVTERRRNGRVLYTATYEDALKVSETDEQGITTLYTYDSRERVQTRTKVGVAGQSDIVTTFAYDAKDRMTEKTVAAGGLSLTETWAYDPAGRLSTYTDQAGYVTTYAYANGGRTVTRTNPDTSVVVTDRHLDGKVKEMTGNGAVNEYYAYAVNTDGSITTVKTIGRSDALRVAETTRDMLGRIVEQRQPGFGTGDVVRTFVYDERGLLIKKTETEMADTLHVYDSARQMIRTGLDLDQNGSLGLASADRITEEETYFWEDLSGNWWRTTQERVYPDAGLAIPTVVRESRIRIDGFDPNEASEVVTLDTQGNQTIVSTVMDRSTVTMTMTTDVPESSLNGVETYVNGLLQTRTTTSVAQPTAFTYDALARKISEKHPRHSAAAEWNFDANTGLLTAQRDADGNQTSYTYHPNGQLGAGQIATITDALGQVGYRGYNLRGQLAQVWGETEYPVEYAYNAFGERVSMTTFRSGDDQNLWTGSTWPVTPPTGDVTTWAFDEATGLLTAKTDAKAENVTYTYTTAGRMEERFWARLNGQGNPLKTTYVYDPLTGERTLVDYADGTTDIAYGFDRIGRLDTVTDAAGSRSFDYNGDLQLESETIASFYGTDKRLSRTYETGTPGTNVVGRYVGFSLGTDADPDADYTVCYGFDDYGRLNAVTDSNSSYSYGYMTDSNLLASVTSPVHTTSYSYETNRDLKTQVQNGGYSTYAYRYDAIGRRTDRVQSGSAFTQASFDAFEYNTRSEVIGSDRYLGTDPTDTGNPVVGDVFAYDFDPIGNRLSASIAGVSESYTTNELNQYLSAGPKTFTHDADGNLTSDGNRNFTWTAENRLKSVEPLLLLSGAEKIEFEYDYLGRRIQKTVSEWNGSFYAVTSDEKFLYDGWNLIARYELQSSNFTLQTSYTWGLDLSQSLQGAGGVGGLLGVEELSGTHTGVYHFAFDANGNVTEVLDNSGGIAAHYEFDPFGNTIRSFGTYADANTFRFSTKYLDDETEFYYYGYRHYDPTTGRWLSRDPIAENGGINLYAYVENNPINWFDPLGLQKGRRGWRPPNRSKCGNSYGDYAKYTGARMLEGAAVVGELATATAYLGSSILGGGLDLLNSAGASDPVGAAGDALWQTGQSLPPALGAEVQATGFGLQLSSALMPHGEDIMNGGLSIAEQHYQQALEYINGDFSDQFHPNSDAAKSDGCK
jgi:RHS repeat-associated protein